MINEKDHFKLKISYYKLEVIQRKHFQRLIDKIELMKLAT